MKPSPPSLIVTYRNAHRTDALDAVIHEEAAKLPRFFERIVDVRVTVDRPHRHHRTGSPFHVRIDIGVPGDDLVINKEPTLRAALLADEAPHAGKSTEIDADHRDAERAVRDAFRKAERRLRDYARRKAGI
jgi:ribosome-associated translation inhibitor RaiA